MAKKGRPAKYNQENMISFLESHADELFEKDKNGKIVVVVKSNTVWDRLAKSPEAMNINTDLSGPKLYCYVVNNQGNFAFVPELLLYFRFENNPFH